VCCAWYLYVYTCIRLYARSRFGSAICSSESIVLYEYHPHLVLAVFPLALCSLERPLHSTMPLLKENAKQHMCSDCAQPKTQAEYSASMWKNRVQARRHTLCAHCEAARTLRRAATVSLCRVCGKHKSAVSFFAEAWKRRGSHSSMQCIDCEHPACTAPQCKQCRVCREHHRKDKKCQSSVQPRHSKRPRPTTLTEAQNFVCSVCRPILCNKWPECSKVRKATKKKRKAKVEEQYLCGDCEEAAQPLRLCRVCEKHKSAVSLFPSVAYADLFLRQKWPEYSKVRKSKKIKARVQNQYLCGDCEKRQFSRDAHKRLYG
jgi:hypothetical protein